MKRSLEDRVLNLEISILYRSVTRRLIEIYDQQNKKPEPQVSNESFDVREAARRLNVRPGLVRKLVKEGRLKAHRIGKLIRFSQTALDEFLASQVMEAKPKPEPKGKRRREVLPVAKTELESKTITRAAVKKLWK